VEGPEYKLTFEDRGPYLYVRLEAEVITLGTAVSYLNEVMGRLRGSAYRKLLLIRDTPMHMTERQFKITAAVLINLLPSNVRFALVDLSPSFKILAQVMAQCAAEKDRQVKVFNDLSVAEKWLLA